MSLTVVIDVMIGAVTLAALSWARSVLDDEDRYVRAVDPLARSPRIARIAGRTVALAVRARVGTPLAACLARIVARWSMGTRAFGRSWPIAHRALHRARRVSVGRGSGLRLSAAMLTLASLGEIVGAASRVQAAARVLRSSGSATPSSRSAAPKQMVPAANTTI